MAQVLTARSPWSQKPFTHTKKKAKGSRNASASSEAEGSPADKTAELLVELPPLVDAAPRPYLLEFTGGLTGRTSPEYHEERRSLGLPTAKFQPERVLLWNATGACRRGAPPFELLPPERVLVTTYTNGTVTECPTVDAPPPTCEQRNATTSLARAGPSMWRKAVSAPMAACNVSRGAARAVARHVECRTCAFRNCEGSNDTSFCSRAFVDRRRAHTYRLQARYSLNMAGDDPSSDRVINSISALQVCRFNEGLLTWLLVALG